MDQVLLTAFSLAALYFISGRGNKRLGFFIGILAQPFWFYSGWSTGKWGICVLSPIYAYFYWRGMKNERKANETRK